MAFTEFCCRSGGSNLNAGTRTGNSTEPGTGADFTYASGNWVAATGVFTVASGNPLSDGVAVGDFASVYANGSTVTGFVGRVTARTSTTITVDLTDKSGTAPTDGTGNRTLKIGGAWQGPNGAEAFPFNWIQNTLRNVSGDTPRVNFKNSAAFNITATAVHNNLVGPGQFEGYATAYGDGGRAVVDGGTSGASYVLLGSTSGNGGWKWKNFELQNNGATGSEPGFKLSQPNGCNFLEKCVAHDVRGQGFYLANGLGAGVECEAYNCNQSNTATFGGFYLVTGHPLVRCISHHNSGSNNVGIYDSGGLSPLVDCIVHNNGLHGLLCADNVGATVVGCDFYENGGSGIHVNTSAGFGYRFVIENCNFFKNGAYGINSPGGGAEAGVIRNNAFGSGTMANTSGQTNGFVGDQIAIGSNITYTADQTPWQDPANGNFTLVGAAVKNAGRGSYTQTMTAVPAYGGTVGYPDIGAAQHLDAGGAATPVGQCCQ